MLAWQAFDMGPESKVSNNDLNEAFDRRGVNSTK